MQDSGEKLTILDTPVTFLYLPEAPYGLEPDQKVIIASERDSLRIKLEKEGKILLPEHEFVMYIQDISSQLGIPQDTQLMILDNESRQAFFHKKASVICFSRGFARVLMEDLPKAGFQFSKDHIAAVLAHEIAHAQEFGDKYTDSINTEDYLRQISKALSHAEEFHADREAMEKLAKAGFNPKAMIEILRTFPLSSGRFGISHPEILDRIRKLEDILADDEHPIANTGKERTPIASRQLSDWIAGESDMYQMTDTYIGINPQNLEVSYLEAGSQNEFHDRFALGSHIERVGMAKTHLSDHDDFYERITKKMVIANALIQYRFHLGDKEVKNPSEEGRLEFYSILEKLETKRQIFDWVGEFRNTGQKAVDSQKSRQFHDKAQAIPIPEEVAAQLQTALEELEALLDRICTKGLADMPVEGDATGILQELRWCYETGNLTEEVFRNAYPELDQMIAGKQVEKDRQQSQDWGARDYSHVSADTFDFSNPEICRQFIQDMKLALAVSHVSLPSPSERTISHVAGIISRETQLPPEIINLYTGKYTEEEYLRQIAELISSYDIPTLVKLLEDAEKLQTGVGVKLSVLRPLHIALFASADDWFSKQQKQTEESISNLKTSMAFELYIKSTGRSLADYEEDHAFDRGELAALLPEAHLSLELWQSTLSAKDPDFRHLYNIWLVRTYLDSIENAQPIDPKLWGELGKIEDWPQYRAYELTMKEAYGLLKNPPWRAEKLRKIVKATAAGWTQRELSEEEVKTLLEVYRMAYHLYEDVRFTDINLKEDEQSFSLESEKESTVRETIRTMFWGGVYGEPSTETVVRTIKEVIGEGMIIKPNLLSMFNFDHEYLSEVTDAQLEEILGHIKGLADFDKHRELYEMLLLYSKIPAEQRPKLKDKSLYDETYGVKGIIDEHREASADWLLTHFDPSVQRDRLLVGLYDLAPDDLKPVFFQKVAENLSFSPDRGYCRKSAINHPYYLETKKELHRKGRQFDNTVFQGKGRLAQFFPDILKRRHAFASLGLGSNNDFAAPPIWLESDGSARQRLQGERLVGIEPILFDGQKPLDERIQELTKAAPMPSIVRDIHLEIMLRDELEKAKTPAARLAAYGQLRSLFSQNSSLVRLYAVSMVKDEVLLAPEIFHDPDKYLTKLKEYFPHASLDRNFFLSRLEDHTSLSVEKMTEIIKLRLSEEGKSEEDRDSPVTFAIGKLSELNREEKVGAILWLMGLTKDKPKAIVKIETDLDGHLDGLPGVFLTSTPDAKEVMFKRFFLGAEGIVDFETVPEEKIEEAQKYRSHFTETFAQVLLPDSMPRAQFFRKIFQRIIEESDPPHASRFLQRLINQYCEAVADGEAINPEKVVALGLGQLGVVGKKVSQSLAEMDWVPEGFRKELRVNQEAADRLSKRALYEYAEVAGLFDATSPVQILSFDVLLGAASNKQACLLTVKINDPVKAEELGLKPREITQLVGKFKRPSSQKTENIDHDLGLLTKVLDSVKKEGIDVSLPSGFTDQINRSIRKELDFEQEKQFASTLKKELATRGIYKEWKTQVPLIVWNNSDLILETVASSESVRTFIDKQAISGKPDMVVSVMSEVAPIVLREALHELLTTGTIHADIHPGNVFIDPQRKTVTLIDLGMNVEVGPKTILAIREMMAGLVLGNRRIVLQALKDMGWDLPSQDLKLAIGKFAENTKKLLTLSRNTESSPPEALAMVIYSLSKLESYTKFVSGRNLIEIIKEIFPGNQVRLHAEALALDALFGRRE